MTLQGHKVTYAAVAAAAAADADAAAADGGAALPSVGHSGHCTVK